MLGKLVEKLLATTVKQRIIGGAIATAVATAGTTTGVVLTGTAPVQSCSSSSFTQPVYTGPNNAPTSWSDVSEFQTPVDGSYRQAVFSARANDGTYRDHAWLANCRWARSEIQAGRLAVFVAYFVYRPDVNVVQTLESQIGVPFPGLVVMDDIESWSGQITGDHSAEINSVDAQIARWLGSPLRVVDYGNRGDLASIAPLRTSRTVVADYTTTTDEVVLARVPGGFARQYTDALPQAPFGTADGDRYAGSPASLAALLGVPVKTAPPKPAVVTPVAKVTDRMFAGQILTPGHILTAGTVRLSMQHDGNLVLYRGSKALSESRTNGRSVSRLALQHDGNLVLYSTTGKALWQSRTYGKGADHVIVQAVGRVIVTGARGVVWQAR